MNIAIERRIRLAKARIARDTVLIKALEAAAIVALPDPPPKKPKTDMVGDVIEHVAIRMFGGTIKTPMLVKQDRGDSFVAECTGAPLPDGSTLMAFHKHDRWRTWL